MIDGLLVFSVLVLIASFVWYKRLQDKKNLLVDQLFNKVQDQISSTREMILIVHFNSPNMEKLDELIANTRLNCAVIFEGPPWLLKSKMKKWNRVICSYKKLLPENYILFGDTMLITKKKRGYKLIYEVAEYLLEFQERQVEAKNQIISSNGRFL